MFLDELAVRVFSFLCHQDPSRTFCAAGEPLTLCARCVGVYVGFILTLPLMIVAARLPRKLAFCLHGFLVLQVIPFGFHLIPNGPTVRTVSGQLFALGVVYFIFMAISMGKFHAYPGKYPTRWLMRYLLVILLAVTGLQSMLRLPWSWTASMINALALTGLGVFAALVIVFLVTLGACLLGPDQSV